jgi:hypothetical protein
MVAAALALPSVVSLSVLSGPENPDMTLAYYTNLKPGETQRIYVCFLWYGREGVDAQYYNPIVGVPLKFYVDGEYKTTITTNSTGSAEYTFVVGSSGVHTFRVVFEGDANYPPHEASGSFTVVEPSPSAQASPPTEVKEEEPKAPLDVSAVRNILFLGGAVLIVAGLIKKG